MSTSAFRESSWVSRAQQDVVPVREMDDVTQPCVSAQVEWIIAGRSWLDARSRRRYGRDSGRHSRLRRDRAGAPSPARTSRAVAEPPCGAFHPGVDPDRRDGLMQQPVRIQGVLPDLVFLVGKDGVAVRAPPQFRLIPSNAAAQLDQQRRQVEAEKQQSHTPGVVPGDMVRPDIGVIGRGGGDDAGRRDHRLLILRGVLHLLVVGLCVPDDGALGVDALLLGGSVRGGGLRVVVIGAPKRPASDVARAAGDDRIAA